MSGFGGFNNLMQQVISQMPNNLQYQPPAASTQSTPQTGGVKAPPPATMGSPYNRLANDMSQNRMQNYQFGGMSPFSYGGQYLPASNFYGAPRFGYGGGQYMQQPFNVSPYGGGFGGGFGRRGPMSMRGFYG